MLKLISYRLLLVCTLAYLFTSCTKNVTVIVPPAPTVMTVEGHVEPSKPLYLYLSTNFAFYGNISISNILNNNVIHNALVTVNDGYTTDTMTEFIPSIGFYLSKHMTGVIGRTYNLTVKAIGQTATATTTLLDSIPLDSVWFKVQPNMDTLGFIWAKLTSPLPAGRCYRWLAQRIGQDTTYIAPPFSAFNDQFFAGQNIEFAYQRGMFPGSTAKDDTDKEAGYFKVGETVSIKFCVIDPTAYLFFKTLYTQQADGQNPFGSTSPVLGNINGGQGIWCGYGTSYKTVICK